MQVSASTQPASRGPAGEGFQAGSRPKINLCGGGNDGDAVNYLEVSQMKNLAIVGLLGLLVWFGAAVVRLENIRYANDLDMCAVFDPTQVASVTERWECLDEVQTRTNFAWHLLYGLKVL